MVFGDTAGWRPELCYRAGVERFAPLRTRGWGESLHPPGLSGAKYLTPLGGMTEFPLRREAWDAAKRRLGLAWFARGLTAGRLVQLPSKPNAVRRGTRARRWLGPAWYARGLTAGRLSLVQAQRREAWGAARRGLRLAWFARGLTAGRLSLVQAQRREAWGAARRGLGLAWLARGLTAGRLVQLPSKPNAVRRGTLPGGGWVKGGSPAPYGRSAFTLPIPTPSRGTRRSERSDQNRLDHVAVDVGEAALDADVVEGQPGVIEAEEVQDRGV